MMLISSMVLLQQYFSRRRALAVSIASTGFSVGGLSFGPLTAIILDEYDIRGTLLIIAGIFLQISVICAFFRPAPVHCHSSNTVKIKRATSDGNKEEVVLVVTDDKDGISSDMQQNDEPTPEQSFLDTETDNRATSDCYREEAVHVVSNDEKGFSSEMQQSDVEQSFLDTQTKSQHLRSCVAQMFTCIGQLFADVFDFSLLRRVHFQLFVAATFCVFVGLSSLIQHIPSRAEHFGVDPWLVSLLPTLLSSATGVSRLIFGFVANLPCTSLVLQFAISVTLSGLIQIMTWTTTTFETMAPYCVLQGTVNG